MRFEEVIGLWLDGERRLNQERRLAAQSSARAVIGMKERFTSGCASDQDLNLCLGAGQGLGRLSGRGQQSTDFRMFGHTSSGLV